MKGHDIALYFLQMLFEKKGGGGGQTRVPDRTEKWFSLDCHHSQEVFRPQLNEGVVKYCGATCKARLAYSL